jgi:hypothetical protein
VEEGARQLCLVEEVVFPMEVAVAKHYLVELRSKLVAYPTEELSALRPKAWETKVVR